MTQLLILTASSPLANSMGNIDGFAAARAGFGRGHGSLDAIASVSGGVATVHKDDDSTRPGDQGDRLIAQLITQHNPLLIERRLNRLDFKQRSRRYRCRSTIFKQR